MNTADPLSFQVISEQTEPVAIKLQVGLENQKPAKFTNHPKKHVREWTPLLYLHILWRFWFSLLCRSSTLGTGFQKPACAKKEGKINKGKTIVNL